MGWHVSYACVKGKDRQTVLDDLDLETLPGEVEQAWDAPLTIADLPNGWIVLFCDDVEEALQPEWLTALANGAEVAACQL